LWRVFGNTVALSTVPFAVFLGYLFFWPVPVAPAQWSPHFDPGLSGPYVENDEISRARLLPIHWVEPALREAQRFVGVGPETVALGPDGWLYTGLCDADRVEGTDRPSCTSRGGSQGWVVRIDPRTERVERYVQTGGRPLGLAFDERGRLYIADGAQGLLRVDAPVLASPADANGRGAERFARRVASCEIPADHSVPPRRVVVERSEMRHASGELSSAREPGPQPYYTDSVALGRNPGTGEEEVWFTCPSQRWSLENIHLDGIESRGTGRVLRYSPHDQSCDQKDPLDCPTTLVADELMFANGIAIAPGRDRVWVSEWYGYRVTELTPAADQPRDALWSKRIFFDNAPGYPDNLTFEPGSEPGTGTLWVGLVILRMPIVDRFHPHSFLKDLLARLPGSAQVTRHAFAIGLDESGRLRRNLQDATGLLDQVTGVYPVGNALYFASNTAEAIGCIPRPGAVLGLDPCRPEHGKHAEAPAP
jgi:sugar lactone lactonase YvrE